MAELNVDPPGGKKKKLIIPFDDIAFQDGLQDKRPNQPYILDLVTKQRLFLQTVPMELNYGSEGAWATIAPVGMNNPFYHYTGSEDTLTFSITWYSDEENRQDVIKKCKWIESLTKNDGYENKPHPVQFIMGDLYRNAKWIVYSAPYKMANFNREFGMMPQFASQEITLKRISPINRMRSDILKYDT